MIKGVSCCLFIANERAERQMDEWGIKLLFFLSIRSGIQTTNRIKKIFSLFFFLPFLILWWPLVDIYTHFFDVYFSFDRNQVERVYRAAQKRMGCVFAHLSLGFIFQTINLEKRIEFIPFICTLCVAYIYSMCTHILYREISKSLSGSIASTEKTSPSSKVPEVFHRPLKPQATTTTTTPTASENVQESLSCTSTSFRPMDF